MLTTASRFRQFKQHSSCSFIYCLLRNYSIARKYHCAIIGSGPAGFYCAQSLARLSPDCSIDIFDKSPFPYGLIRYGVAPDHPEVKNCINHFERLFEQNLHRFHFFGNVQIGRDLNVDELRQAYDVVIFAYGAECENELKISGVHAAKNVISARRFVGWYNGFPDHRSLEISLNCETAVIIGHGNVALDAARMLLIPIEKLRLTDIPDYALDALSCSRIKRVVLVGRRGPLQVAFTIKELRELINLPGSMPKFNAQDFSDIGDDVINALPRQRRRLIQLMVDTSRKPPLKAVTDGEKFWKLSFLRSPKSIQLDESNRVNAIEFEINNLLPIDIADCEKAKAVSTGFTERLECGLVLSSIGYKSLHIDKSLPFDAKRCVLSCSGARVASMPGVYACGWCARGPVGVLAATQLDASAAAKVVVDDINSRLLDISVDRRGCDAVFEILKQRNVAFLTWEDWKSLDLIEQSNGETKGKPREKILSVEDCFNLLNR